MAGPETKTVDEVLVGDAQAKTGFSLRVLFQKAAAREFDDKSEAWRSQKVKSDLLVFKKEKALPSYVQSYAIDVMAGRL
jgi:hypothetical protein